MLKLTKNYDLYIPLATYEFKYCAIYFGTMPKSPVFGTHQFDIWKTILGIDIVLAKRISIPRIYVYVNGN